jgi:hypothetical protein
MELGLAVIGDRKIQLAFDEFPKSAHVRIFERITGLTAELKARIEDAAPKGATGELEASISSKVYDQPERIRGRVAVTEPPFGKAAALEYGAHKATPVKAHRMRRDHVFARRLAEPLTVEVKAYTRQPNIVARRYLRGPLEAIESDAIAGIREALEDAITQAAA